MKKTSLLLVALMAGAFLVACGKKEEPAPVAAPAPAPVAVAGIVVGLDDNFPPMGFRDEKNEIVGFDVDLAREAGKRLGANVTFKPIDWSAKEAELAGKRVDLLWNGLTITEERKANILFSSPYLGARQLIVVPAGSPIKGKADLKDKVVGIQEGSSANDSVAREPEVAKSFKELKKYGDNITALMDIAAGRLDAMILAEIVGRYYTTKKPGVYVVIDEHFGQELTGVGMRKEDTDLHARLEKVLADMKADGSAAAISVKWFGKDIIHR